MKTPPYDEMQLAVDIVNLSPHPTSRVAATLFGNAPGIARTNYWPAAIAEHFGTQTDIGNSSGTVHAETACILAATAPTDGASLCVTDPFCPNCAKNIAEAGIRTIYIDHKGFGKDFAERRGDQFQNMSMQICARAGISVYEIRRKERVMTPILEIPDDYRPANDSPVVVQSIPATSEAIFLDLVADSRANMGGDHFAVALAFSADGRAFGLCARRHLAVGYSRRVDVPELHDPHGKYTFILEPANRLLMNAARLGLRVHADYIYSATTPTARELVNLVGAGIHTLHVGDEETARDDHARRAVQQLSKAGILNIKHQT